MNKSDQRPASSLNDLEIGIMPSGDFMIHVFVESVKNLKADNAEDGASPFDAIVQIDCCSETKYSTVMKNSLYDSENEEYLGEHFFFEPRNLSSDQIQSEVVVIKIMEKAFLKNSLIG